MPPPIHVIGPGMPWTPTSLLELKGKLEWLSRQSVVDHEMLRVAMDKLSELGNSGECRDRGTAFAVRLQHRFGHPGRVSTDLGSCRHAVISSAANTNLGPVFKLTQAKRGWRRIGQIRDS